MTCTGIALALLLVTGAMPSAQESTAPARLLEIDIVAVDGDGVPVTDLKPQDVEVWVAGYRTPIDNMLAIMPGEERGRTIVLLLDDITVPHQLIPHVRQAARRLVSRMTPGDRMAIVGLSGEGSKITEDSSVLLARADAYNTRPTSPLRPDDLGAQVLQSIAAIARQIAEAPGRRKTIVAIGSGWLFDRPLPPPSLGRDLQPVWVDTMRALASTKTSVYVIDPGGVGNTLATGGDTGFARETGGHAFMNTNDFNGVADKILREASTYYVLRVTDPPAHRKAPLREVEVRPLRRGITIRARRGIAGER